MLNVVDMIERVFSSPIKVFLFTAGVLVLFAGMRWASGGHDFSNFILPGPSTEVDEMTHPLRIRDGGYDGQFFYRLALDPWDPHGRVEGVGLDNPVYRHQRILYPAIVWALSGFGNPSLVPFFLVFVNILSLALIAWIFASIAGDMSLPKWLGMLPAFSNGLLFSLGRDTAEPTAALCLIASIYFIRKQKYLRASLGLALGVLARETMIIPSAVHWLTRTYANPRVRTALVLAIPILVFLVWQFFLRLHWGAFPFERGSGNIGLPLVSLFSTVANHVDQLIDGELVRRNTISLLHLFWMLWFAKIVLPVALRAIFSGDSQCEDVQNGRFIALSWLTWLALISLFTNLIWVEYWAFARVSAEWSILGWALLFHKGVFPGYRFTTITAALVILDLQIML